MNTRLKGRVAGLVLLGAVFFATNAYPSVAPGTALGSHRTVTFAAIDSRMTPDRQPELAEMLKSEAARVEARLNPQRPS